MPLLNFTGNQLVSAAILICALIILVVAIRYLYTTFLAPENRPWTHDPRRYPYHVDTVDDDVIRL